VRIRELTDDVLADVAALVREKHHELNVQSEPDLPEALLDPQLMRQVVLNLTSNAIKYTPRDGRIDVRIVGIGGARAHDDRIGVEVRDTGPGIPPDLRARVFEEFFRVRASTATANGNGLGLAISRRIARLLGGDVTYADNDGGGSVFTLWLRRSKESGADLG
jgi:signal transduction histidine kinase